MGTMVGLMMSVAGMMQNGHAQFDGQLDDGKHDGVRAFVFVVELDAHEPTILDTAADLVQRLATATRVHVAIRQDPVAERPDHPVAGDESVDGLVDAVGRQHRWIGRVGRPHRQPRSTLGCRVVHRRGPGRGRL